MKKLIPFLVIIPLAYLGFQSHEVIYTQISDPKNGVQNFGALLGILVGVFSLWKYFWQNEKKPLQSATKNNHSKDKLNTDHAFEKKKPSSAKVIDKEKSPYRGLEAFRKEDEAIFFGRQREIRQALSYIGRPISEEKDSPYCYWLQIQGNSGAGKSSLVRAGLLPLIETGYLTLQTGVAHWKLIDTLLPGETPIRNLARVLEKSFVSDASQRNTEALEARLKQNKQALANLLQEQADSHPNTAFVLVVDQFEELFTFANKGERIQFDALLANALKDKHSPLCLITTVRLDFLGGFEKVPELSEMYNLYCRPYLLKTISQQGLKEIIESPAKDYGLDVSDVIVDLLSDAKGEEGVLPLVENALQVLWLHRQGNKLSADYYHQKGGLVGLLEEQADELLEGIDKKVPKGKQYALDLLLALTRVNEGGQNTRRRLLRDDAVLNASGGKQKNQAKGEEIIDYMTGHRPLNANNDTQKQLPLLMTTGNNKERYIDIIHETLIRPRDKDPETGKWYGYWKTLYAYIEKNRERSFYSDQLERKAKQWASTTGVKRWRGLDYPTVPPIKSNAKAVRENQAVVNVSWIQANGYLQWLEEINEKYHYRLPTEAEWEYVARAGTETAYAFEDTLDIKDNANCRNCNTPWAGLTVAPVASYKPNKWGFYDMHGNVWEWTSSEWQVELTEKVNQYKKMTEVNGKRVLRGGSWDYGFDWLRSSARDWNYTEGSDDGVGFRVFRFPRTN